MTAPNRAIEPATDEVLCRAIAGVLARARQGHLPLFVWTLGLAQTELLAAVETCCPRLLPLEILSEEQYAHLQERIPPDFNGLVKMLLQNTSQALPPPAVHWLARALASACFGDQHLWQDLALPDPDRLSNLLRQYFAPIFLCNTENLHWKHHLFTSLAAEQGFESRMPAGSDPRNSFSQCFPTCVDGDHTKVTVHCKI